MEKWEGCVVLVIGVFMGLGRVIVKMLVLYGICVVVCVRSIEKL